MWSSFSCVLWLFFPYKDISKVVGCTKYNLVAVVRVVLGVVGVITVVGLGSGLG